MAHLPLFYLDLLRCRCRLWIQIAGYDLAEPGFGDRR